ncbi:hypothetical protein PR202_ga29109 [Eleusine coracana subsp. coracana]|uniref:SKP1-like protein n=1 Tax=Eleusine coracana subsp. coracana TaxID=191504 RepID=A0AAV5DJZ6_ELECO|nr:hypothetical protein QOZ80_7AG0578040 [Eleusine coracana subsp. coracana]GJN10959.1 hypothetical protein PR202_ga29109 [Eleusine coracana subsp. coracana]
MGSEGQTGEKGAVEALKELAAGERMITLTSSEGQAFRVSEAVARLSPHLAGKIGNGDDVVIALPDVPALALVTVIEYCTKHAAIANPSAAASSSSCSNAADAAITNPCADAAITNHIAAVDAAIANHIAAVDAAIANPCAAASSSSSSNAADAAITNPSAAPDAIANPSAAASSNSSSNATDAAITNSSAAPDAIANPSAAATTSSSSNVAPPYGDSELDEWDRKLVGDLNMDALYHVLMAAYFLRFEGLVDTVCQKVADVIKSCETPKKIRETFGIPDDLTPEEKEGLLKEFAWAFGPDDI